MLTGTKSRDMNYEVDEMIVLDNVSKYFGRKSVLRDVSLALYPGSITAVIGQNGSGKTTLLNMISGYWSVTNGSRYLDKSLKNHIDYLFQARFLDRHLSIKNNLSIIANMKRVDVIPYVRAVESKLKNVFGVVLPIENKISSLSAGQRRMLEFCVAVTSKSKVILLDEPTANLDVLAKQKCLNWLSGRLDDKQLITVISTHDPMEFELCEDYIFISQKKITSRGKITKQPYREIFEKVTDEGLN